MNKYRFSYAQKYALWRVYEIKCFYCEKPLDFRNFTIDHVIPEYLNNKENEVEWKKIRTEYELDEHFPNFLINDYCNWVPSDRCNFRKGRTLFSKGTTLFYLEQIQKRLPEVTKELIRLAQNQKESKILGEIGVALEENNLSTKQVIEFLRDFEFERTREEPLIITLGLTIDTLFEEQILPELPEDITASYVALCDWLEKDLSEKLRSHSSYSFHYTEESARDGEVLSVRLVFPELSLDELNELELDEIQTVAPWWEILEVTNFYQVYRSSYHEVYQI